MTVRPSAVSWCWKVRNQPASGGSNDARPVHELDSIGTLEGTSDADTDADAGATRLYLLISPT